MSVLVTGGAGYIGGHMTLGLLDGGESVVVLDNLSTGFAWAVPDSVRLVVGDTGDAGLVARLIKENQVDAIAHFAAGVVVPEFGTRSARLLSQQRLERAHADRIRRSAAGSRPSSSLRLRPFTAKPRPNRCRSRQRSRRSRLTADRS